MPSNGDALGYFLYLHKEKKMTIRQSSTAVIEKIAEFWHRARIPMGHKNKMIEKFEALYRDYQLLKKGRGRRSVPQMTKEKVFKEYLRNLFDVASADVLSRIANQKDKDFLLAQREPGRREIMGSMDKVLAGKEALSEHRRALKEKRRQHAIEETSTFLRLANWIHYVAVQTMRITMKRIAMRLD